MSTTSFSNTPQARDDLFAVNEESSLISGSFVLFDVMSNDLGGKAKTLFSIDDGYGGTITAGDLLNADSLVGGVSAWETTANGNLARINNGKIEIDLSHSFTSLGISDIDGLGASDTIADTLIYAIRLGNGTLSWARVNVTIQGVNDTAQITGDAAGTIGEDDTSPVTGTVTVSDLDRNESYATAASGNTDHGTWSVDANGNWSFTVNNASVQYLNDGESVVDTFTILSLDGTASATIAVTIEGESENLSFVRSDIGAGQGPISVVIEDVNADGQLDLVVANGNSFSTASAFLGNGDGTFGPRSDYSVGESHQVALADLNGDGNLDMVNANSNSSTVSVALGNGNGTFQSAQTFVAGNRPISIAIGDVNSDGIADIATANYGSTDASILLGNGDGTFGAPTVYSAGTQPGSVQLGDLNGDGALDLVIGNQLSNDLTVRLGVGDGTFGAEQSYAIGGLVAWSEIADVNNDTISDVLACDLTGSHLVVLLGNGDGTLQGPIQFTTGQLPFFFASGDLDNDGDLDVVTANINNDSISILRGNGDGTFESPIYLATGSGPTCLDIADIDGDGRNDIVVGNGNGNTLSIFMNDTDFIV